jgi:flagellar P-ring protein precursor FlgI
MAMTLRRLVAWAILLLAMLAAGTTLRAQTERVADLTSHAGEIPKRLVGYGLVFGLEGSGDRSFGVINGGTQTVRSVANLLRRQGVEVPADRLRPRNVAAVIVTAEASPYLRAGGRFEVQVSSLGDATSLKGGVLLTAPLSTDVDQPPVATAQGPVLVVEEDALRSAGRRGTSARIPEGGVLEVEPAQVTAPVPRLVLKRPDLGAATRIADAVNAVFGTGTAKVTDPGAVELTPGQKAADNVMGFLAAVDTVPVRSLELAKIVIDARNGTVVAGGDVKVGAAVVSHRGITISIATPPASAAPSADTAAKGTTPGLVSVTPGASVQEVAAALHTAGARPQEISAMFEALREVGAITAQVVVK